MLDLGYGGGILETAEDRADGCVVVGVQAVEDGLRQHVVFVQGIEVVRQLISGSSGADAVVSGIRAEKVEHPGVVVTLAAVVELHDPISLCIFCAHKQQEGGLKLHFLLAGDRTAGKAFCKDLLNLLIRGRSIHDIFQAMVGYAAAHGSEEVHAQRQSVAQVGKGSNPYAGDLGQCVKVFQVGRLLQIHGFVGPPRREYLYVKAIILREFLVPDQGVCRIIGGTDEPDIGLADDITDAHGGLSQLTVAEFPHFVSGVLI